MLTKAKCSGKKAVIFSTKLFTAAVAITAAALLVSCAKSPSLKQMNAGNNFCFTAGTSSDSNSDTLSDSCVLNQEKSILKKYTTHPILFFESFAIGGGQNAAFAIVTGQQSYHGDVWYITASGAQKLKDNIDFPEDNKPETPFIWTVGNVKMFKCESNASGSGSSSYAWYIKE